MTDPDWIDQHIVTLGPRYGPEESARSIAADYIAGLEELVRRGQLQGTSRFVMEVTTALNAITKNELPGAFVLKEEPESATEAEILVALHLSLGVMDPHSASGTKARPTAR